MSSFGLEAIIVQVKYRYAGEAAFRGVGVSTSLSTSGDSLVPSMQFKYMPMQERHNWYIKECVIMIYSRLDNYTSDTSCLLTLFFI